jgi:hypothetical protein
LALKVSLPPFLTVLPLEGELSVGAIAACADATGAMSSVAASAATRRRGRWDTPRSYVRHGRPTIRAAP